MPALTSDNSYVTYSEFVAYAQLTGRTPAAQDVVEPRLIQATLAIDRTFAGRFLGRKTNTDQPLQWPRSPSALRSTDTSDGLYTVDSDGNYRDLNTIPQEVKDAVCETAIAMATGFTLYTQPKPGVTEATKKIDVLQTTMKYAGAYYEKAKTDFTINLILRPVLTAQVQRVFFTA